MNKILEKFGKFGVGFFMAGSIFFSHLGGKLGFWVAPAKKGLLPYEEPAFQTIEELYVHDAFAYPS